jgi:hypothetical protein
MRKFNAGTSTTFLVLQRQTDLVSQRGRELQAQTDLNKAEVEIDRVSGAIFVRNGFNVGTAATAPPPQTSLPARASPPPVPVISPLP